MTTYLDLVKRIKATQSVLCIGLDPEVEKIPDCFFQENKSLEDAIFDFNKSIIDATHQYAVAYKPNAAFYECLGLDGVSALYKTVKYIRDNHSEILVIYDAKRGDIGNTSKKYAEAAFESLGADAITLSPYLGEDGLKPFFQYLGKWGVVLALTSNKGSADFQEGIDDEGLQLFEKVVLTAKKWSFASDDNLMFVAGATKAEKLKEIRVLVPSNFLLVPGVGAQGGSATEVIRHGAIEKNVGLLINSSRGIIFADDPGAAAQALQQEMAEALKEQGLV